MTVLQDYGEFKGRHWETGSVRNYYAYRGVLAPHTGEPYTEAFFMGVSGGAVMGYFSFAYEGYDPHVALLTRNTFDPLNTLLERLGVVQDLRRTSSADRAVGNLVDSLQNGLPAIVWADVFSLPYNDRYFAEDLWVMMPIIVYGYDDEADEVWIADRARVPLHVSTDELAAARGKVKKTRYQLMTLDPPNPDKLATAVHMGLWDCVKLYTEAPPKGSKKNFGFEAFRLWSERLTRPTARESWFKVFPPGRELFAGLTTAYKGIRSFGKDGSAERDLFADFLDEAALILGKPALREVAVTFRQSAAAWDDFAAAMFPEEVPLLAETREILERQHQSFLERGHEARDEISEGSERLREIRAKVAEHFPMDEGAVQAFQEDMAAHLRGIQDLEEDGIRTLKEVLV